MSVIEQQHNPISSIPSQPEMSENCQNGTLIIIGGRAERQTLHAIGDYINPPKDLAVVTLASGEPEPNYENYKNIFDQIGIDCIHFGMEKRSEQDLSIETSGVFVTGGKQDMLMERLAGTPLSRELGAYYRKGGTIIGTSAGASFMGEIMPVGDSYARGFGFITPIIDQHFSQKNRKERLIGLVEKFPDRIGIGIDENTAVIYKDDDIHVMGEGDVYVITPTKGEVVLREGDVVNLSMYSSSLKIT